MESSNKTDQLLREKLGSMEHAYDPKAWTAMEALLDKKKKRRGILWWWLGGSAVAAMFIAGGFIVWGLHLMDIEDHAMDEVAVLTPKTSVHTNAMNVHTNSTDAHATATDVFADNKSTRTTSKNVRANSTGVHAGVTGVHTNNKNVRAAGTNVHTVRMNGVSGSVGAFNLINNKQRELNEASTAMVSTLPFSELPSLPLAFLSGLETPKLTGKVEDEGASVIPALSKKKKNWFNYHLGARADLMAGMARPNAENASVKNPAHFNYAVGIFEEYMFFKRLSITDGFLFSQSAFTIEHPGANTSSNSAGDTFSIIDRYTCRLTELQIPIGLKVYALNNVKVKDARLRLFFHAGIINHIKLKEVFDYSGTTYVIPPPANVTPADTTNGPPIAIANFDVQNMANEALFADVTASSYQSVSGSRTSDLSINKTSRYYTSFYAGMGVEFVFKKQFQLFAEPTFQMSIQEIGVQQKRKYNMGLSVGFKYMFEKD